MYDYAIPSSVFLDCLPFISKEETRYYLCGVNIRATKSGAWVCATNGRILLLVNVPDAIVPPNGDIIISADRKLIAACKAKTYHHDLQNWIAVKGSDVSVILGGDIFSHEGLVQATFPNMLIEGSFPNYTRVIPDPQKWQPGEMGKTDGFNAAYLAAFAGLKKDGAIQIIAGDSGGGIYAVTHSLRPDCLGVIMPIRCDAESTAPEWFTVKGETEQ